jgi:hypothetical protein
MPCIIDLATEVVGAGPDIDHLVVLLALGHQAGRVLVFDLLYLGLGALDDLGLLVGNPKSFTPIETPERVEYSKPVYISWSAKITVALRPSAIAGLMICEMAFLAIGLLTSS